MNFNFDLLKNEIEELLNNLKVMVLATSFENRVTARSMSIVNDGLSIFFQTDKNFFKCKQILFNNTIALCADNIQIEGTAKNCGHPLDPENLIFQKLYKRSHSGSFEKYSKLDDEVVFKVDPTLITLWKYVDGKPCRDILFYANNKTIREFYEPK